jgi:hypothetical protein
MTTTTLDITLGQPECELLFVLLHPTPVCKRIGIPAADSAATVEEGMKHTPGPWKAHFEEAYFVTGPDLGRVAMMMNLKGALGLAGRRSGEESAANCRLIAAAPDLLEALLGVLRVADRKTVEFDAARAAIAKAGGDE